MKFSLAHILSVVLDRSLVSSLELMKFLEYMCGCKLEKVHSAAASDLCVLPLAEQFPWVERIKTASLDNSLRLLSLSFQQFSNGLADSSLSGVSTEASEAFLKKSKEIKDKWLAPLEAKYGKEFEVKTLEEMGAKPFSRGYFNHWWLNNIARR